MNPAKPSKYTRPGPLAVRILVDELMDGPQTYSDLVDACGLHRSTLCRWLAAWRRPAGGRPRCVHIAEWTEDVNGRRNTPAFAWGNKPDAKRRPISEAERKRAHRARRRAMRISQAIAGAAQIAQSAC